MAHWIELETPHGPVRAWRADPGGPSHGAVIVLQEIFGVNPHVRDVAGRFADAGYMALAPSLYDPVEPGVELDYDADGTQRGVATPGVPLVATEAGYDFPVNVDVFDRAGEKVFNATITMWVSPKPA